MRYAQVKYMKSLFTNIQKQWDILKILHAQITREFLGLRMRAKFSGYCFYMNTNIYGDFQICISVPLRTPILKTFVNGFLEHNMSLKTLKLD